MRFHTVDSLEVNRKLEILFKEKETVLNGTLQLADSIQRHLDSLFTHTLQSPESKEEFNNKLQAELLKRGCRD
jgi:hypothetical protein